jgi:hypothetical protein
LALVVTRVSARSAGTLHEPRAPALTLPPRVRDLSDECFTFREERYSGNSGGISGKPGQLSEKTAARKPSGDHPRR